MTNLLVVALLFGSTSYAQWVVEDIGAATQRGFHFFKQVQQMSREAEHMKKQIQSLSELGWKDTYKLEQHLRYFESLQRRAKSLSTDYRRVDSDFNRLYSSKNGSVEKKLNDWDKQTEDSIRDSMKSHGVVDDSKRKMKSVSDLVNKQRRAQGNLAAIQTLGELTAVLARQIEELKTIVALDSRATQSKAMEEKAIAKAVKEQNEHLMKDFTKPMKAKRPMTKFPSLGKGN